MTGGISVSGQQGTNMKTATTVGTIPTELGNLKAWKYVVFGEWKDLIVLLIQWMTIDYQFISRHWFMFVS